MGASVASSRAGPGIVLSRACRDQQAALRRSELGTDHGESAGFVAGLVVELVRDVAAPARHGRVSDLLRWEGVWVTIWPQQSDRSRRQRRSGTPAVSALRAQRHRTEQSIGQSTGAGP